MAIKLSDLRYDSWFSIRAAIRRGDDPDPERIITALRREEPNIPGEVQLYLADLLTPGAVDRRGRPKKAPLQREIEANALVCRVARWHRVYQNRHHATDPQRRAFEKVAVERKWKNADVTARKYYEAIKFTGHSFARDIIDHGPPWSRAWYDRDNK
jgi:hypothetical protein